MNLTKLSSIICKTKQKPTVEDGAIVMFSDLYTQVKGSVVSPQDLEFDLQSLVEQMPNKFEIVWNHSDPDIIDGIRILN